MTSLIPPRDGLEFQTKKDSIRQKSGGAMSHPRMSWDNLLSTNRLGPKDCIGTAKNDRSEFERDIDRIMFSGDFLSKIESKDTSTPYDRK